ncbi:MAG: type II toxin-antitoxin system VapC family toxin [Actinobacteria bacterium]|nr:MAG: type II toxin-antitoxin system VapC family toxin [Actinomycetota bacterium]
MKLPDVNLLIYAADEGAIQHAPALAWVEDTLSGTETVAFAWSVLMAFVRLITNPRILRNPWHAGRALEVIDGWLAQPPVTVVHPTDRHVAVLRDLLVALGTAGNLTSDAHLAALAIEHGATLCSCDVDFSRFPGLRWIDPLHE